jgi:hypothetical protein
MTTLQDAQIVAKKIKDRSPKVHSIELFGSVARKGIGHDMDLILIVDEDLSRKFWPVVNKIGPHLPMPPMLARSFIKKFLPFLDRALKKNKKARQDCASNLIGLDLVLVEKEQGPSIHIDAWLVPANWREHNANITSNRNMAIVLNAAAQHAVKIV